MDTTPSAVHAAPLTPLGAGIILDVELKEPHPTLTADVQAAARGEGTAGNQFVVEPITTETLKDNFTTAGDGASAVTTFPSPPPSPPSLCTRSSGGASSKRGSGRFQSMDDSFCDRIRSTRCVCVKNDCDLIFDTDHNMCDLPNLARGHIQLRTQHGETAAAAAAAAAAVAAVVAAEA